MIDEVKSTVAVVIPTSGRESLAAAVRSALSQARRPDKVIVATSSVNASRVSQVLREFSGQVDVTTSSADAPTGGYLRWLGSVSVDCDWYAFLDDDDEWVQSKLERQIVFAEDGGFDLVSSALHLSGPNGVGTTAVPASLYQPGQSVGDYLFAGRKLRVDRPLLHTSTLLVSKKAIDKVNWDPELRLHQDWDFLLRVEAAGFRIGQMAAPLTHVATGTSSSMSATNRWSDSHSWWTASRGLMSRSAEADFLYSQVLRYALSERKFEGVAQVLRSGRQTRRPTISAVAIALTGLVPRSTFEQVMLRFAGARRSSA